MKIDQLIYFAETAKEEHIGRAAKILGISPSAISHSIASLEGELQLKLFQKKGKNIFLTVVLGRSYRGANYNES
jgi:LysR family transcriptional activator of glutamate synthase operon